MWTVVEIILKNICKIEGHNTKSFCFLSFAQFQKNIGKENHLIILVVHFSAVQFFRKHGSCLSSMASLHWWLLFIPAGLMLDWELPKLRYLTFMREVGPALPSCSSTALHPPFLMTSTRETLRRKLVNTKERQKRLT